MIVRLMRNWYSFHFLSIEDLETIRTLPWVHGKSFLDFHQWYIGHNPLHNIPSNKLIQVKLPGLPIKLWTNDTLIYVGNAIGKFVYVDLKCLGAKDKRVAQILIEKEYRGGFPDHIYLHWGDINLQQRLDFWGVPFHCSTCHRIGHLKNHCPFHPRGCLHGRKFPNKSNSIFPRKNQMEAKRIRKVSVWKSSCRCNSNFSSPHVSPIQNSKGTTPITAPCTSYFSKKSIPPPLGYLAHPISPPPSEPSPCQEVPTPLHIPHPLYNILYSSHITYVPSSSPSPMGASLQSKGKEPCLHVTPQVPPTLHLQTLWEVTQIFSSEKRLLTFYPSPFINLPCLFPLTLAIPQLETSVSGGSKIGEAYISMEGRITL